MSTSIAKTELIIIKAILKQHLNANDLVYVFGSRAKKTYKKYSDLDLAINASGKKIPFSKYSALRSAFEESDLPYKVDFVDIATVDDVFRQIIKKEGKLLKWHN